MHLILQSRADAITFFSYLFKSQEHIECALRDFEEAKTEEKNKATKSIENFIDAPENKS